MSERIDPIDRVRWVPVNNTAAQAVPAYGVVRVTGVDTAGAFNVARPSGLSQQELLVCDHQSIPVGGSGRATGDDPVWVLYDTADGTPAAGEYWGVEANSFKIRKRKKGFKILGGATTTGINEPNAGRVLCHFDNTFTADAIAAEVANSSDQTVAAMSSVTLTWNIEVLDTGQTQPNGYWSDAQPTRLTVGADDDGFSTTITGFVSGQGAAPGDIDPCNLTLRLLKNGAEVASTKLVRAKEKRCNEDETTSYSGSVSHAETPANGDYYELQLTNGDAAIDFTVTTSSNFRIQRASPDNDPNAVGLGDANQILQNQVHGP